jgi:hypothetical protein
LELALKYQNDTARDCQFFPSTTHNTPHAL